jgi:dUTP pyrophosphatase
LIKNKIFNKSKPMQLKIKLLRQVPLPAYGRAGDAALDLRAVLEAPLTLAPGERTEVPSGVAMAIPAGFVGLIFPRGGWGNKGLHLGNVTGVIDSNYRGEIMLNLVNNGPTTLTINPLDRVMQLAIMPVATCTPVAVTELDETNRGDGRYGSSGVV